MAKVRLKEKTDAGHKILHPETLALNVITGTGNVQSDIQALREKIIILENTINTLNNMVNNQILGNTMIQGMVLTTNTAYASPAGYRVRSIVAMHAGTVTSIVFSVSFAASQTQYQINSNYPAAVSCMVVAVFEKI